jgi:uncharacterized protein involved in outer membrane biogenesis
MSKSLKRILFAMAGLIGLLILISVAFIFFVDTTVYKPRVERAASKALGMEVRVGGRLGVGFFPGLRVSLDDVHVRNRGMDIASAEEARLEIALLPLLHKEVQIRRIRLLRPRILIKRDRDGAFNFEPKGEAKGTSPALDLGNLSLSDGAFLYEDKRSEEGFEMDSFTLDVRSLRMAGGNGAELLKHLSFTAEFACREFRTKGGLVFSDLKITGKGKDGIFALDLVTLRLFGGQGSGSIGADFSGPVPRYSVRSSLTKYRIEAALKALSPKKIAEGSMDFSASLSMQGNTVKEITQTAAGEISLRGKNLTLYGYDLDREFDRFESSQSLNLVDVGAFFFAGPIGLVVTKGYDFASIFRGSGGSSSIGELLSDWKVERGIAHAKDVALTTKENRVALTGNINFVNERFDAITMALIDARGCARVKQKIHGPLRKPTVEKPSVLMSLAGPALNLLKQAEGLFTGGTCEVFYTGSVPAPK